jgi:hypothetical protein
MSKTYRIVALLVLHGFEPTSKTSELISRVILGRTLFLLCEIIGN